MIYTKTSIETARKNATYHCGKWYCNTHGIPLKIMKLWRTIGLACVVKEIAHIFCARCADLGEEIPNQISQQDIINKP